MDTKPPHEGGEIYYDQSLNGMARRGQRFCAPAASEEPDFIPFEDEAG